MNYREEKAVSKPYKEAYLAGLETVIAARQKEAKQLRLEYVKDLFNDPEKYRAEFRAMLGWPLTERPALPPAVITEKLADEEGYSVYRMQFMVLDGLVMTGLFFKQNGNEKKPLVIVQHGGYGTPELVSGAYNDTQNYNDLLMRVIKHGVHAFAPQLLLWHQQEYELDFDRVAIDARLKRVGSSITAVEIFGITRILDYFETQDYVGKFGMVGLSYGGFYTLFTAAADTRIASAISCSFFNKRDAYPWPDWTWLGAAGKFDDAEIACLVYPRRLCLETGDADDLFDYRHSEESFETLKQLCKDVGTDWVDLIVFNGFHEFHRDDAPIERLINDLQA